MFLNLQKKIWQVIKKTFKIRSFGYFKAKIRRKIERKIYKNKYTTAEIITLMKSLGLTKGSTVFIHSSWSEFYNYQGTIVEFINAILSEIGKEGTLAMPAYPSSIKEGEVFKIKDTPTAAGKIAETFRRYPGVKRSVDRHSVCAIGHQSDYLLQEHQYSATCWDKKSPYYKLGELDALIFSFGLGRYFIGTSSHCVDSILKDEILFFNLLFQKRTSMKFQLEDGSTYTKENLGPNSDFLFRQTDTALRKMLKHFDKSKYKQTEISNLKINVHNANYLIRKSVELGRIGVVAYGWPAPSNKLFTPLKTKHL